MDMVGNLQIKQKIGPRVPKTLEILAAGAALRTLQFLNLPFS